MNMIRQVFTMNNPKGMHSRVAKQVAGIIRGYNVEATVDFNGQKASGESILELLSLAITYGSSFTVSVEGPDSYEALSDLSLLFSKKVDP